MNHLHKQLLYIRCDEDDLQCLKDVIQAPNSKSSTKRCTNLPHRACSKGTFAALQFLINYGADIGASLHYSTGSAVTVRLLCTNGANPSMADENGNTALHFVVEGDDSDDVIQTLVNNGASVNARNSQGKAPLHHACIRLQPRVVESLLQHGADANAQDAFGATALHYLALYQKINVADSAIENLPKIMEEKAFERLNSVNIRGYSQYMRNRLDQWDYLIRRALAVDWVMSDYKVNPSEPDSKTHLSVTELVLRYADLSNVMDKSGRTPLHIAAANGHIGIAQCLVHKHRADVCHKDIFGTTALHEAASNGYANMVQLLLCETEKSRCKDEFINCSELYRGQTALHKAIECGHDDIVDELLKQNANVNIADSSGNAPLHVAIKSSRSSIVGKLLSAGADASAQNCIGNTPLHGAIAGWKSRDPSLTEIIKQLVCTNSSVDINRQNYVGRTPLHFAVGLWHMNYKVQNEIVRLLCQLGAQVGAIDGYCNTPLHVLRYANSDTVALLASYGANINVRNVRGMTPLHAACLEHRRECVKELLNRGAICNAVDAFGATPLHYACRKDDEFENSKLNDPIVTLLIDCGADCNIHMKVTGRTPLHLACENDQGQGVNELQRKRKMKMFPADVLGNSLSHYLTLHCEEKMPSLLKICPHLLKNKCGMTCLHLNAKAAKSEWMNKTFSKFLAMQDNLGRTCLHVALSCDLHLICSLRDVFGLCSIKDFLDRNCFHHMCITHSLYIACSDSFMELVRSNRDLINARDKYGRTPLFYAVIYQNEWFRDGIISAGADRNMIENYDFVSPGNVMPPPKATSITKNVSVIIKDLALERTQLKEKCTEPEDIYQVWENLQIPNVSNSHNAILREKAKEFVTKIMHKVAELDALFTSTPTLVGSSFEGTRADRTYDEFDFMIVLDKFESLLDYSSRHECFPTYICLKQSGQSESQYQNYTDMAAIVQPVLVKERLYSLLVQACYSPDVWEDSPFEYLRTEVANTIHSPAVAVKLSLNNLIDDERRLHFYRLAQISIDFVPAVPTKWELASDTDVGRYVQQHVPENVDRRGFAVMKPHKYSIGNDADGFCPVTFIFLESEIIRKFPTVRAAYTMMKWLLFCRMKNEEVKINKYALKTCVVHCVVGEKFHKESLREVGKVTKDNLIHCIRVILEHLWRCVQEDRIRSFVIQEHYQPVWKFEPFAGFMKTYLSRYGLLYKSDFFDPVFNPSSINYVNKYNLYGLPSLSERKVTETIQKLRYSYNAFRTICEMFAVHTTSDSNGNSEISSAVLSDPTQQRLIHYTMKYDEHTHERIMNDVSQTFLMPSTHRLTTNWTK